MKRPITILAAAAALAAGCGSDEATNPSPRAAPDTTALAGAPAPLAALHRQSNELLDGGPEAFERRIEALRGYPVVVNKWASWCPPCRAEFPFFRSQSIKRGKRVAFLGVDSSDNDASAERFLREHPVPYPSYKDPELKVAAVFKARLAFPSTAFYDSQGELAYLKQGGYQSERQLASDIDRYAR